MSERLSEAYEALLESTGTLLTAVWTDNHTPAAEAFYDRLDALPDEAWIEASEPDEADHTRDEAQP
jgi:hypothetical protein